MADRFCEGCGVKLVTGVCFCEECGSPVSSGPPKPGTMGPAPSSPPGEPKEQILAVLPFASRPKGFLGSEGISLVFTSRRIIPVPISPGQKGAFDTARERLEKEIRNLERNKGDRSSILSPLAFSPVPIFPPWSEIFPDLPHSGGIALGEIEYIRGEVPDEYYFKDDSFVISTSGGEQQFHTDPGWFRASVSRLTPLIWEAQDGGAHEQVVGIIPLCQTGEWGSSSLFYSFTLIVTTRRILFSSISDQFSDSQVRYLNRLSVSRGTDLRTTAERYADGIFQGAPWMEYSKRSLNAVFDEDPVNFYISLKIIRHVTVVIRQEDQADELTISLPSHSESFSLEPGLGNMAADTLTHALGDRVRVEHEVD